VAVEADLAGLGGLVGRRVHVGGLVVANDGDEVLIDDGTGTGALRLGGDATALLPLLEPGDAIAAAGRVLAGPGARIEVRSAGDVTRLGDLGEALPLSVDGSSELTASAPLPAAPPAEPGAGGLTAGLPVDVPATSPTGSAAGAQAAGGPLLAGAGFSLVVAAAWTGAVAARRRRERRRSAARLAERLAGLP
jgi:hypothetical protein